MNYPFIEISEVANFINGFPFKPEDWESTGLPIIRIQNLTGEDKPYNFTKRTVPKKYLVKNGDILISWSATIDVFEWNQGNALLNQHIFKVDFARERIDKQYFKKALKRTILELSKYAHGSTMKHVVKSDFESHKIPLPPLNDQIRIAHLLSKVEGLIARRKQHLQHLDNLLKSVFLEMFGDPVRNEKGWEIFKFSEIFAVRPKIGTIKPATKNNGIPVIRVGEIGSLQVNVKKCAKVELDSDEYSKCSVAIGDILLARAIGSQEHLGKASLITKLEEPLAFDSHIMRIRFDFRRINPAFAYFWLKSDGGRNLFLKASGKTSVQFNINSKQISSIEMPLPNLNIQNKFASITEKVEILKSRYQKNLTDLESLYGALSQEAFKGELDLSRVPLPTLTDEQQPIAMRQRQQELFEKEG